MTSRIVTRWWIGQHDHVHHVLGRFVVALAALHPWSPDLQVYWDGTLLREEHFDKVIGILYERRRSPLKRYGNSPSASPAERKP